MPNFHEGEHDGSELSVAVVVSRFNETITERLLDGCVDELARLGVEDDEIDVFWVPGAFELAQTAEHCVESGDYEAVICLGCVIRGETSHYDHVAKTAATEIATVAREALIPVIFGVLTTENSEQAEARSGGSKCDHGEFAARAAVEMASLLDQISDADEDDAEDEDDELETEEELEAEGVGE
jgi:6,7-dimethyl-8-ribityllumazine synthase